LEKKGEKLSEHLWVGDVEIEYF